VCIAFALSEITVLTAANGFGSHIRSNTSRTSGTEADMGFEDYKDRIASSWQLPLLVVSFGLLGYAGYLLVDPKPGPTIADQFDQARKFIEQDRPDAAIEKLNKLVKLAKLEPEQRGDAHLLLAQALDQGQQLARVDIDANHKQIIEQTALAIASDKPLAAEDYTRLGNSQEKLGQVEEALVSFRKAAAMDTSRALHMHRRVIELLMSRPDPVTAEKELLAFFQLPDLSDVERAWALGLRGQLAIDDGRFAEARTMLEDAARLSQMGDASHQGEVAYRRGYAAWKTGDLDEAERLLRSARDLMGVANSLDADAAMALGDILISRDRAEEAASFYTAIVVSHPDAAFSPLARLQLGLARATAGEYPPALEHFRLVTRLIESQKRFDKLRVPAISVLKSASRLLSGRGSIDSALEVLSYEQSLDPTPPASFFLRLGEMLLLRADALEKLAVQSTGADKIRQLDQMRDMRGKAGTAFVTYSQKLTLLDDSGYADALWRGIDAYDRAGNLLAAISALELFVAERPGDALAPEALLRLGKTYQAAGMFEKSIAAYQKLQLLNPQTLAAIKSAVPLAQAYMSKGPAAFADAERVLMSVIENNAQVTPDSNEFRQAVFELGNLFYRTGRFEDAVVRLDEFSARYPNDPRQGQLRFLMGDSYRKSAQLLADRAATLEQGKSPNVAGVTLSEQGKASALAGDTADQLELMVARRDRLRKSRDYFGEVVDLFRNDPPRNDVDKLYLKLSHFYRADAAFDLGEYEEAVRLYDAAAFRYQDDPSSLAAYVQIVNAYVALGRVDDARTANERARWMLRRMPGDAFEDAGVLPRQYWEQYLGWAGNSGLWNEQDGAKSGNAKPETSADLR